MKRTLVLTTLASLIALAVYVAAVYAADQNTRPYPPPLNPAVHGRGGNPYGEGRPEPRELPRILMVAAVDPKAKDDPEVQKLLDKAISDIQVLYQDEATRLAAFQQLVQSERSGDADAGKAARKTLSDASQKVSADARQVNQDRELLFKRIRSLTPRDETGPGPGLQSHHSQNAQPSAAPTK